MDKITIYKDNDGYLFAVNERTREVKRMTYSTDLERLFDDIADMAGYYIVDVTINEK